MTPSPTATFSPSFSPTGSWTATPTFVCTSTFNLGFTAQGSASGSSPDIIRANRIILSEPATLIAARFHLASGPGNLRVALYNDNGSNHPGTLQVQSPIQAFAGFGWNTFDFPDTVLSGPATYWLAHFTRDNIIYDRQTGAGVERFVGHTDLNNLPSSFPAASLNSTANSLYAIFCAPDDYYSRTPTPTTSPTPTITSTPTFVCTSTFNLGFATPGSLSGSSPDNLRANRIILSEPATLIAARFHLASGPGNLRLALYNDNGSNHPGTLLVQSPIQAFAGFGWNTFDFPDTVLSGPATYWLTHFTRDNIIYDRQTGAGVERFAGHEDLGNLPSNFPAASLFSNANSLYAIFCAPDDYYSRTPTPTVTLTPTITATPTFVCTSTFNLGFATPGSLSGSSPDNLRANRIILSEPATLIAARFHLASGPGNLRLALYGDNGSNHPGALLVQSPVQAFADFGWNTFDFPDTVLSGPATYWLAHFTRDSIIYDKEPNAGVERFAGHEDLDNLPSSFPAASLTSSANSLYALFCAPDDYYSRTPTPTITATPTFVCASTLVLGRDTEGGTGGSSPDVLRASRAVLSQPANVVAMRLLTSGTGNLRLALYGDNGSDQPGALLAQSGIQACPAAFGWKTFDLPDTMLSGPATYWLAFLTNDNVTVYSDPTGGIERFTGHTDLGNLPDPFPASSSTTSYRSIYAVYCQPLTPTWTPTISPTPIPTLRPTETPLCAPPYSAGVSFQPTPFGVASGVRFIPVTFLSDCTVQSISFLTTENFPGEYQVALYDDDGASGFPGTLRSSSQDHYFDLAPGWFQFDIPDAPVTAGNYWLSFQATGAVHYYPGNFGDSYGIDQPFGPFPNPASGVLYATQRFSLYANYCLPTGVPTYTLTPTPTTTFTPTPIPTLFATETPNPSCTPSSFGLSYSPTFPGVVDGIRSVSVSLPACTVTGISFLTAQNYPGEYQVALYDDDGGSGRLGTRISASQDHYFDLAPGWFQFDVPDAPVTAGTYWLAFQATGAVAIQGGSPGDSYYTSQPFGPFPSPASSALPADQRFSFIAHTCP